MQIKYYLLYGFNKMVKKIEDNKYLIMLDLEPNDLVKLSKSDRMVESFMKTIEEVNQDPEFREYMSAEEDARKIMNSLKKEYKEEGLKEGLKEGLEQGIEQGIEQGMKYEKIEIAKSMLKENINIEVISKCTELTIDELNDLKN